MLSPVLSSGIVPVRYDGQKWLYLLLRAYGYWDFPKGRVEPGEEPWKAALRELREETGIGKADPQWGLDYYETAPYSGHKIARYYLACVTISRVQLLPTEELGRPEHDEYRWLSYEDARGLLVPRVQKALDWANAKIG